jgi:hypothetical protein
MAFQPEWQNRRTPPPSQDVRERMRANLERNIAESKAKGYGPANFDGLLKPLNRKVKKTLGDKIAENMRESEGKKKKQPSKSEMRRALANGSELHAVTPSDCFQDLFAVASDDDGTVLVTGVFANPTRGEWQYEMTLDEFLDWANDDLGVAFNEWVRGNYEA